MTRGQEPQTYYLVEVQPLQIKKVSRHIWGKSSPLNIRTFEENSSKALLRKEFQSEDEVYVYISSLTPSNRWEANARVYCYCPRGRYKFGKYINL